MRVLPPLTLLALSLGICLACGSPGAAPAAANEGAALDSGVDGAMDVDAIDADATGADAGVATDATSPDVAGPEVASPDAVPSPLPVTLTEAIVSAAKAVLADDPTRGLTLTIDVPGLGRWATGIGLADAEQNLPMQGADHLRVGSITKTFVAAAVLRDVEAGKLSLDDSVAPLLPAIQIDPAITVRMLLGHRSGIFNYTDDANFLGQAKAAIAPAALYAGAAAHAPEFAPGTGYKYSNTNFIVLGMLLEKLHGVALHTWLRQTLWAPLQLKDVWFEGYEELGLQHVAGYLAGQPALAYDTSWAWAAGALAANGSDLCTWLRALYVDGTVLGATTVAAMVKPSPESKAAGDSYGLGTMIDPRGGRAVVGHTGSTMGFNGEVYIDRDSGICVAVLTNDFFGVRKAVARKVWDVLLAGL